MNEYNQTDKKIQKHAIDSIKCDCKFKSHIDFLSQSRIDFNVKLHEITYFKLHWWMITDIAVRLSCSNMQMLRFNISHFEFDSPLYLIASTIWMKWGDNKNVHGTTLTVCGFFYERWIFVIFVIRCDFPWNMD